MPQRGDNPNEVLYETGTAFAHHVDNYYDMDSSLCRPVDDMLAAIEEALDCPLVHLVLRREQTTRQHEVTQLHDMNVPQPKMPSFETVLRRNTEQARIQAYFNLENHEDDQT